MIVGHGEKLRPFIDEYGNRAAELRLKSVWPREIEDRKRLAGSFVRNLVEIVTFRKPLFHHPVVHRE